MDGTVILESSSTFAGSPISANESCRKFTRGPTQFYILVRHELIERTALDGWYSQLLRDQPDVSDHIPGAINVDPFDSIYAHCLPLIEKLAPEISIEGLHLDALCRAQTLNLELVSTDDNQDLLLEDTEIVTYTPAYNISSMPIADLPGSCGDVRLIHASDIQIAPREDGTNPLKTRSVQGKVYVNDQVLFLKPRLEGQEKHFDREIESLGRITQPGFERDEGTRVPDLVAIAVSGDNDEEIVGVLFTWQESSVIDVHLVSPGF